MGSEDWMQRSQEPRKPDGWFVGLEEALGMVASFCIFHWRSKVVVASEAHERGGK